MSWTLSAFNTTLPDVTVKSVESKLATPLFDEVASSADTVIVFSVTATSIPSPPDTCNPSVSNEIPVVPVSPLTVSIVATLTTPAAVKRHGHLL